MQSTHNAAQPIRGKFMEIACIFPLSACNNPDSAAVFDQAAPSFSRKDTDFPSYGSRFIQ